MDGRAADVASDIDTRPVHPAAPAGRRGSFDGWPACSAIVTRTPGADLLFAGLKRIFHERELTAGYLSGAGLQAIHASSGHTRQLVKPTAWP